MSKIDCFKRVSKVGACILGAICVAIALGTGCKKSSEASQRIIGQWNRDGSTITFSANGTMEVKMGWPGGIDTPVAFEKAVVKQIKMSVAKHQPGWAKPEFMSLSGTYSLKGNHMKITGFEKPDIVEYSILDGELSITADGETVVFKKVEK